MQIKQQIHHIFAMHIEGMQFFVFALILLPKKSDSNKVKANLCKTQVCSLRHVLCPLADEC